MDSTPFPSGIIATLTSRSGSFSRRSGRGRSRRSRLPLGGRRSPRPLSLSSRRGFLSRGCLSRLSRPPERRPSRRGPCDSSRRLGPPRPRGRPSRAPSYSEYLLDLESSCAQAGRNCSSCPKSSAFSGSSLMVRWVPYPEQPRAQTQASRAETASSTTPQQPPLGNPACRR